MASSNGTQLNNPYDPLAETEKAARELFKRFGAAADGFTTASVVAASLNILINAIRQTQATRSGAEARWDELMGRNKGVLMNHYDPVTGRRRNIFPFTQIIVPEFFKDGDEVNPH